MTHEQRDKILGVANHVRATMTRHNLSNAEVIRTLAIMVATEVQEAQKECGEPGRNAVLEAFMRDLTVMLPSIGFQLIRKRPSKDNGNQ